MITKMTGTVYPSEIGLRRQTDQLLKFQPAKTETKASQRAGEEQKVSEALANQSWLVNIQNWQCPLTALEIQGK